MTDQHHDRKRPKRLLEEGSLWVMIAVPSVWAAHFLLCYWIAAVWCAKFVGESGALGEARLWIWALTVAALMVIALLAWHAVRRYEGRLLIQESLVEPSDAERTRFLGHATLLLCGLSAVAVVFDVIPTLVFDRCG